MTDRDPIDAALERLADDGLVAFPTETVWGLAARAQSERGLARLREWKGREAHRPVAVLVSGPEALVRLGVAWGPAARALAAAFWPGPLTLVLSTPPVFATGVAREDGAVGVRWSSHPVAAALAQAAEAAGLGPLTATSLNRTGSAPARTQREAQALCGSDPGAPLCLLLASGEAFGPPPSTVVDLAGPEPRVLRWGAIDPAQLGRVLEGLAGGEARP
jgi:L-threonylcarbamoyladenylate synthase